MKDAWGSRPWGRAVHPVTLQALQIGMPVDRPACQAAFVAEGAMFCRNCEHLIPEGQPFTVGVAGTYCRDCLEREGWLLIPEEQENG